MIQSVIILLANKLLDFIIFGSLSGFTSSTQNMTEHRKQLPSSGEQEYDIKAHEGHLMQKNPILREMQTQRH